MALQRQSDLDTARIKIVSLFVNITNNCWLYRQGGHDPNRISFETTPVTKAHLDAYKANLLANQGVIKLKV